MLLTLTTTHSPATDLGYLLHKNPARPQVFDLSFGKAHVFYPSASDERCTAALMLQIDPVGLVRQRRGPAGEGFALQQYVNDRPYVASSFLSVAIAQVFGSALSGICKQRPDLAQSSIPLEATLPVVPSRGGEALIRALFEPLGYEIALNRHPLDESFPSWGESPYFSLTLRHAIPLHLLLSHLYVLIPVLDDDKHYWVDEAEVEKLLRHGETWLAGHPQREQITRRYLRHRAHLTRAALARLIEEDQPDPDQLQEQRAAEEQRVEQPMRLNEQRMAAVLGALKASGAKSVIDIGCGNGNLLRLLADEKQFERIAGMDVSHRALEIAVDRLNLDRLPEARRNRFTLFQGSLTYRDKRLAGYDAAAIVEVIEHLDPPRLSAFERVIFEFARPRKVVVTTPNVEYNVKFPTLAAGTFRHRDHRFEWTREEFGAWANSVAARFDYDVRFEGIGPADEQVGSPTQMAILSATDDARATAFIAPSQQDTER
ncbi:MAG TPA: 3' terminal RNA ribose 2'-O-methyltransferase Hen1 [Humisphaera sp.]|nr:3' terminal RNA ribose 2'-O-methyltransferase Hen1 [Humisphaera sp.]